MAREFAAVHDMANGKGIDMRTAAYAHALNRISQAVESQGTSSYFSESGAVTQPPSPGIALEERP